jgi:hypothetical protein
VRRALAIAAILVGTWAAVAAADGGGPSPGPSWGGPGKVDSTRGLRYVALNAGADGTLVESVRLSDGVPMTWTVLHGQLGIPMVAWDGTIGGLSRDGRRLVLASSVGGKRTRFAELDPVGMRVLARARLRGSFAFDALSPNGSLMYLIQYLGSPSAVDGPYAVRVFSWKTRTLYPDPIVDRREPGEKMNGQPVTRTGSPSGWAYTLYSRTSKRPFVHALDTIHRRAFCVDVLRRGFGFTTTVKLRVRGGVLELRQDGRTIARMNRRTFEVTRA